MKHLNINNNFKKIFEDKNNYVNIQELIYYLLENDGFKKTTKNQLKYSYFEGEIKDMPPMSYTILKEETKVVTYTSDGKETENTGNPGDIVMSGPSKEKYVIKKDKFVKLYDGKIGEDVITEQNLRYVAHITKELLNHFNQLDEVKFVAPWDQDMVLKSGDFLVKDGENDFYRIAKEEYELTYNMVESIKTPN